MGFQRYQLIVPMLARLISDGARILGLAVPPWLCILLSIFLLIIRELCSRWLQVRLNVSGI
jgi:hypothetical protein